MTASCRTGRCDLDVMILGRQRNLLRLIPWILVLLFVVSFRNEFDVFITWVRWGQQPSPYEVYRAYVILRDNILFFIFLFVIWLWIFANRTLLPVRRLQEVFLS